jgi:hypothetical protein
MLAGQLKWNGDTGNHNYLIIITERKGKMFRGIVRTDYGPSGDAKKKSHCDIEGELNMTGFKYKAEIAGLSDVEGKWVKNAMQINAKADNGGTLTGSLRFVPK